MKKLFYIIPLLFAFVACGGGNQSEQAETTESSTGESATTAEEVSSEDGITLVGTDQMKFTVKSNNMEDVTVSEQTSGTKYDELYIVEQIAAKAGEEMTITLENNTNLPAQAMAHNFVLLKKDADVQGFVNASMGQKGNDYIAPDMTDQVIANTAMLAGGESETITFTVPSEPGEYTFVCTFPGHYGGGMVGVIKVTE